MKHTVDWELIRQRKQTQNKKDSIRKNKHRVDQDYKVRYKVIITKHTAYKYETSYMVPFMIKWCFINNTILLRCGAKEIR